MPVEENKPFDPGIETVTYNLIKEWTAKAVANPAQLEFPTDKWGFTSEIKKSVLKAASTIRGSQDKHDLVIAILAVLIQHIKLRQNPDRELQSERIQRQTDAAAIRAPRERVQAAVAAV